MNIIFCFVRGDRSDAQKRLRKKPEIASGFFSEVLTVEIYFIQIA
jgi:hypothetical protein